MKIRSYSLRLTFYGVALGFVMAAKVFGYVFPVGSLVSLLLGLFWPYLTRGQNLSIGSFRIIVSLPFLYREITRVYLVKDTGFVTWSWFYEFTLIGMVVVIPVLVCFVVPYVTYRFYRWKGVFKRMPWGGVV